MDKGKVTALTLLDLSAAFDIISIMAYGNDRDLLGQSTKFDTAIPNFWEGAARF